MGLFGQSCPLEKSHLETYGIPSPKRWKKEDCRECSYLENGKCVYKQRTANQQQLRKRGYPAMVKKSLMHKPAAEREPVEKKAVKKAGFSPDHEQGYWKVSRELDDQWQNAAPDARQDILDSLDQWRVYLETGLSPSQAHEKVKEWLKQRAEFKKQV